MIDPDPIPPELPAFDDQGQPVRVTEPAIYDDHQDPGDGDGLDIQQFVIAAIGGAKSAAEIGERVLIAAYILRIEGAPANLRDMGHMLRVSHTAARRKVSKFCADFRRELEDLGFQAPHQ